MKYVRKDFERPDLIGVNVTTDDGMFRGTFGVNGLARKVTIGIRIEDGDPIEYFEVLIGDDGIPEINYLPGNSVRVPIEAKDDHG